MTTTNLTDKQDKLYEIIEKFLHDLEVLGDIGEMDGDLRLYLRKGKSELEHVSSMLEDIIYGV